MKNADKPINPIFNNRGGITHESHIKDSLLIGLKKREYFAGLALQGLLANCNGGMTSGGNRIFSPNGISELAVLHADELLKQLEKNK